MKDIIHYFKTADADQFIAGIVVTAIILRLIWNILKGEDYD